ncbi:MAG: hypothetical protein Q9222_005324 [Ikaeria aurantiellina]
MDHKAHQSDTPRSAPISVPLPNPPFVFPMQPESDTEKGSSEDIGASNTSGSRHARSRSRPQQLSFNTLPDFEFCPSPGTSETSVPTTPSSPTKSKTIPAHPGGHGHRRNGSEFIGGDGKNGVTGLMSTSPTKGSGILPPPPGARTGPPAGRRGHAHRRSGAISSHDVSTILKPTIETKGGSAPTTPSDPFVQPALPPVLDRSISQPTTVLPSQHSPPSPHRRRISSTTSQNRPRVGFSDHVEFIPRPLSTISSETSSSLSTIRPSHSVAGSISSVISTGNASPPSAVIARDTSIDMLCDRELDAARHSPSATPMDKLEDTSPERRSSLESDTNNLISEPAVSIHHLSYTDVFANSSTPSEPDSLSLSDDSSSASRPSATAEASRSRRRPLSGNGSGLARPRTSPEPKVSKRQRKTKSWADSFFARKMRNSTHEEALTRQLSPTAQVPSSALPCGLSLEDLNFDEDTSCVIQSAPSLAHKAILAKPESSAAQAADNVLQSDVDDDSDVILDLDAALSTSSSSAPGPSFEEVVNNRNTASRRRMHSSGVLGGFDGPGMHYHRRAESAPEMAPINRHIFGFSRSGSNSAMDDVFEEEEEENLTQQGSINGPKISATGSNGDRQQAHGLGVAIVDDGSNAGSFSQGSPKQPTSAAFEPSGTTSTVQTCTTQPVPSTSEPGNLESVEIVDADEEPRISEASKNSQDSVPTPTLTSERCRGRPAPTSFNFMFPAPSPALATPEIYSSAISTPDFSQTSFEGHRLHTATSSITDRTTLNSFRASELASDIRTSSDVPSLTSSASIKTNAHPTRFSSSAPTFNAAERPSSVSGVATPRVRPGNASKRSSLASLSRLVGGSSGEKSKLNIAECVQPEEKEKAEKKSGKRISRLMRFWKPKDKAASP